MVYINELTLKLTYCQNNSIIYMRKNLQLFLSITLLICSIVAQAQTKKKTKKKKSTSYGVMRFEPPKIVRDTSYEEDFPPTCFVRKVNKNTDSADILSGITAYHLEFSSGIPNNACFSMVSESAEKAKKEDVLIPISITEKPFYGIWKIENNLFLFEDRKTKKIKTFTIVRDNNNQIIKLIDKENNMEFERGKDCMGAVIGTM